MAEGPQTKSSTPSTDKFPSFDEQTQVPTFGGLTSPNGNIPFFPLMHPALVPGLFPPQKDQELMNRGPGLYAVPVHPYMQPIAGFPSNNLIPFTYNIPTSTGIREGGGEQGQPGEQLPQQEQAGLRGQDNVRRIHIAIHLDLLLILKLASVVFMFNQDGSKQRLTLLVFFAVLVYLYQIGALVPAVRRLSRRMQRAVAPRQPPRANNLPAAGAQGNENDAIAGEQAVGENENEHGGQGDGGNRRWGIIKEIQMIVIGFITSLLPGFHNN